ncbi:hypothetical protein Q9966_013963 [Columba livia]|nr:hypothetical protein Q9966_013963 [Columba livia]
MRSEVQQTCSSLGSSPWGQRSCRESAPVWASMGSQPPLGSTMDFHGPQDYQDTKKPTFSSHKAQESVQLRSTSFLPKKSLRCVFGMGQRIQEQRSSREVGRR